MIKTGFNIDYHERQRILRLHESYTKAFYLKEQGENVNQREADKFPNTKFTSDTEYTYFAVQPTRSVTAGISEEKMKNWKQYGVYFIAVPRNQEGGSKIMYKANPKLEGDKLSFEVVTTQNLPYYTEKPQNDPSLKTDLKFKAKLVLKQTRKETIVLSNVDYADEMTKNASVGPVFDYDPKTETMMSAEVSNPLGEGFLVNNEGRPGIAIVDRRGEFENPNLRYSEQIQTRDMKRGDEITLIPMVTGVNWKGTVWGLFVPSVFGGYPVPEGTEPPIPPDEETNVVTPKFVFDSGGAETFTFNSYALLPRINTIIDGFVKQVNDYYGTLIKTLGEEKGKQEWSKFIQFMKSKSPHQVLGYASIDADPNVTIKGEAAGCGGFRKRSNYNLCLSQKRADAIAGELKKKIGNVFGDFVGVGKGETNEFTGNDPNGAWSSNNTNPDPTLLAKNRRFIFRAPQYQSQ